MKSAEDIESYLLKANLAYETINPGIWLVQLGESGRLVVSMVGPVVAFRLKIMELPPKGQGPGREDLYRTLLQLNTTEMVHGAFGLEGEAVVIVDALELENLDFNEFQAVIDDMAMAVVKQHDTLARFREGRHPASTAPHA